MWADAEGPSKLPPGVGQAGSTNGKADPPAAEQAAEHNLDWFAVNPANSSELTQSSGPETQLAAEAPAAAEIPASEREPDIVVDSGAGDLALGQFFRPAMWALAWIPLLLTGMLSFAFEIRSGDSISPWPYSEPAYVDAFGHLPPVGLIGRHLLPTGMPQSVASTANFGQDQATVIVQGDLWIGIASLLLGFLIVVMITRRSNDAVYVCGPYAVYSLVAVLMLSLTGPLFDGLAGLFPALLGGLIVPLLVATAAKIAAIAMRNAGIFEIDQEMPVFENLEYSLPLATSGGAAASLASGDSAAQNSEHMPIEHALVCPFCGNPNIQHEQPKMCNACHHNLRLVFEWRSGPRCSDCDGILVRDSVFCHHCGKWQKSQEGAAEAEEASVPGAA
ncbi:zinc ribbon domain-containing protein [bacterium]|nr:zinc ribbon domain-containing protein [bacterium]